MIDNRQVGKKISKLRQANSLTQQQLAAMMNVSHQAVSKWESGQALPDIQTMLQLTRFFGITVEQLVADGEIQNEEDEPVHVYGSGEIADTDAQEMPENPKETTNMSIQQLLQMAPYMSRETVEEIVMNYSEGLTAVQIARIAPYVRPECIEKLIEHHKPELSWDTLRRIAPFMRREAVDALARAIAKGKESVKPAGESINRAINDIGKAFDDIGREMGRAVKKAVRFGENVINEVSSAFSDIGSEPAPEKAQPDRSERIFALRRQAFNRAMEEDKWDWIAAHIGEMEADDELMEKIASCAREKGMQDWINNHMDFYASANEADQAILEGNWEWLGENAADLTDSKQQEIIMAAVQAQKWDWICDHSSQLNLECCAEELAHELRKQGQTELMANVAAQYLDSAQMGALAREACKQADYAALEAVLTFCDAACTEEMLADLAQKQEWQRLEKFAENLSSESAEKLMLIALEQGNFDAVDLLNDYL